MTMYEFNQVGYASLPNLTEQDIDEAKNIIINFLRRVNVNYYMLLNNEEHYYTVFERVTTYPLDVTLGLCNEILSCVKELGNLKAIEHNEVMDGIEFWVTDKDGKCKMYGLFDYTWGVIRV